MKIIVKTIIIGVLFLSALKALVYFGKSKTLLNSGICFSHDGTKLLVSLNAPLREQGQIYLIDLNGNISDRLTRDTKDNFLPVFSPDGKNILFSERERHLEDVSTRIWKLELK